MRTVERIADVRRIVRDVKARGRRVAFVPTMGYLHDGHLALVEEAKRRADFVVMSIFVNPLQFGAGEDLDRYPRDPGGDAAKAAARGVELLFVPTVAEMYRSGDPHAAGEVRVVPRTLDDRWEGKVRPGHFAGVLTVVAKLFNIVQPDIAVFGQKDLQQAALVRAMVRDLDIPVEVVIAPTVRESDGLALSSRNSYLSPDERKVALRLNAALLAMQAAFARGERSAAALEASGRALLGDDGRLAPDYLAVVEPDGLTPTPEVEPGHFAIVAARVGRTRLIDNMRVGGAGGAA